MRRSLIALLITCALPIFARGDTETCSTDPLAQRDEYGLLHQSPSLNPTDLAPRYPFRYQYYFFSGDALTTKPAYVGALQTTLRRLGYYCGPIDGVFSPSVSEAIARLQKNRSERVTGTLTMGVRRALRLP
ncbi:MAG: peptidoglycan-binding domain-containing protein [Chthoniobacterales bacterium]